MFFTKKRRLEHEKLLTDVEALWNDNCALRTMIRELCPHSEYQYTRREFDFYRNCWYENPEYIKKCQVCGDEHCISLDEFEAGIRKLKIKTLEDDYIAAIDRVIKAETELQKDYS